MAFSRSNERAGWDVGITSRSIFLDLGVCAFVTRYGVIMCVYVCSFVVFFPIFFVVVVFTG